MISVITASRNARGTIHDCLTSVKAQSVRPEHVIVDGASTDGTLELLRGWTGHRLELVSEPDQGIYDAMNKGIARANGEIVGILNADDGYASDRVLEQVWKAMSDPSVDACYGDLVYVRERAREAEGGGRRAEGGGAVGRWGGGAKGGGAVGGGAVGGTWKAEGDQTSSGTRSQTLSERGKSNLEHQTSNTASPAHRPTGSPAKHRTTRYWRAGAGTARSFHWGWMPPHPTFFVRRSVYERCGGFRLDMGSAADYELMLRVMVKHGVKAAYIPSVLVRMRVGGVSNVSVKNRLRANRMDRLAWKVNELDPYFCTLWFKPLRKVLQWWV